MAPESGSFGACRLRRVCGRRQHLHKRQPATVHILYGEEMLDGGALDHPVENGDRVDVVFGKTCWTSFQPRGARYVVLVVENASGVEWLDFGVMDIAYNKPIAGCICSGDAFLDSALRASAKTLALCLSDSFLDCAGRERNQWVGDALLSAQVVADLFEDNEPWRRLLRSIASVSVPWGHSAARWFRGHSPTEFLCMILWL